MFDLVIFKKGKKKFYKKFIARYKQEINNVAWIFAETNTVYFLSKIERYFKN